MKDIEKDYTPGTDYESSVHQNALFEEGFEKRVETHSYKKNVALSLEDINEILAMTDEVFVIPEASK